MKFYYPSHLLMDFDPTTLQKHINSVGMIALSPKNELVMIKDLYSNTVWKAFWEQYHSKKRGSKIELPEQTPDDYNSVNDVGKKIQDGLEWIISKEYLFLGLLYLSNKVIDTNLLWTGMFTKRKNKILTNMQNTYRETEKYPQISVQNSINLKVLGLGEKFFQFEKMNTIQIAQMSHYFRGSMAGVIGTANSGSNLVILSQNITKEKKLSGLNLDKNGRETVFNLTKNNSFIPAAGFRFDYGFWGILNLKHWGSLELNQDFMQTVTRYQNYLAGLMKGVSPTYQPVDFDSIFIQKTRIAKKEEKMLATDILLEKVEINQSQPTQSSFISENELIEAKKTKGKSIGISSLSETKPSLSESILTKSAVPSGSLSKPSLPKSSLPKPSLTKVSAPETGLEKVKPIKTALEKPSAMKPLQKLSLAQPTISSRSNAESEDDYEDVFQREHNLKFDESGKAVLNELNEELYTSASRSLDDGFGQAITPELMTEAEIFQDLEASLQAMSQLDELGQKDEAIAQMYYPPPTLLSYANDEGMQIGGSTCVVSMGTGRNLWMVPELKRMQMWGKFYKEIDGQPVEGNPVIDDFVALEEKDIESVEELENIIQKTFISIKRNNHIFMGVMEIEGNGFQAPVFDECDLESEITYELQAIHQKRAQNAQFPSISSDSFIEMHYFGSEEVIQFLANSKSQGMLEIAADSVSDPRYQKGIITGIICVGDDAVNFFILTNNLDQIDSASPTYTIDTQTLDKMFSVIKSENLTPVSWFKLALGFQGFSNIFLWDEVKNGVILPLVVDKYEYYISKLLKTKQQEDKLRQKVESDFSVMDVEKKISKIEDKLQQDGQNICPKCGEEIPAESEFCVYCGEKL